MWHDKIVEEVRKDRERYAKEHNYDVNEIYRDIKMQEQLSGRKIVSFSAKRYKQKVESDDEKIDAA